MSLHPSQTPHLVGHTRQIDWFLEGLTGGRLPHGILLQGPQGIGKATFAYHAARAVLGDVPTFHTDFTSSLFKRIVARSHGDLWVMERRPDASGKIPRDLSIAASRELKVFFSKTSLEGGWRVAIIDSVDTLTSQGAQALLKVLEEPPARCLLLLIDHGSGSLLPTLRSRCQILSFEPLSCQDTLAVVGAQSCPQEVLGDLAQILGGRPGEILAFLEGAGAPLYSDFQRLVEEAPKNPKVSFGPFLEKHFPARSDKTALAFEAFSSFITAWIHFWLVTHVSAPQPTRAEHLFFESRPPLFWAQLFSQLSDTLQEARRLSFDTRHALILTLERLFHGA